MGFLLAVLSCVVAEEVVGLEPVNEEVVKLEPVKLSSFGCDNSAYNSSPGACAASPYCNWVGAANPSHQCVDDKCLLASSAGTSGDGVCAAQTTKVEVTCTNDNSANLVGNDCNGGDGYYCRAVGNQYLTSNYMPYCVYAYIRDGSCPDSICNFANGQCTNSALSTTGCPALKTKEDCGLIPKCYWTSSNCQPDPCFRPKVSGQACSGVEILEGSNTVTGKCIDYKPTVGGNVIDMCIHKDNSKANICYFGIPGSTQTVGDDDWGLGGTYPTLNYSVNPRTNPTCVGTIGSGCEGNGKCTTVINKRGMFAGLYCSDGTHGAANVLRIPSLLVFLVVFLGSLFSL